MPYVNLSYDISVDPGTTYPLSEYVIHPTACSFTVDAINVVCVPTA